MATTWGPWVRVRGSDRSFNFSGSFTITTLQPSGSGDYLDFSNFNTVEITGPVYGIEFGPLVRAYWGTPSPGAVRDLYVEAYDEFVLPSPERIPFYPADEGGSGILGPASLTYSFTISAVGLVVKRRIGTTLPEYLEGGAKRQHMHPTDKQMEDAWFVQPNGRFTASVSGKSVTGGLIHTGTPLEDWGPITPGLKITAGYIMWGTSVRCAHDILKVTVAGGNFNGMYGKPIGGPGYSINEGCSMVGSGDTLTYSVAAWPIPNWAAEGYGIQVLTYPSLSYAWNTDGAGFDYGDPDDVIDPLVEAGFSKSEYVGGFLTSKPQVYRLSQLPSSETVPESRLASISLGADRSGPDVGHVVHNGTSFQVTINEFDALDNLRCPERLYESEDGATEQALHDRYIILDCPGVDGAGGPPTDSGATGLKTVATIKPIEANFFPIAPSKSDPSAAPGKRWLQENDLSTANRGEAEGKYLKWYLDPAEYTAHPTQAKFGGRVALDIQTRYWDRLELLKNETPGISRDWRWPFYLRRIDKPTKLTNSDPEYLTDLFCWKDWAFFTFKISKPKWCSMELVLSLNYAEVDIDDQHYTCESYRVEEFDYTRMDKEARYTIRIPAAAGGPFFSGDDPTYEEKTVVVSLLCPDGGDTPRMLIGTKFSIDGLYIPRCDFPGKPTAYPGGGYLEIDETSMRFIHDPGWDHTGRDTRALPTGVVTPETKMGSIETWDYQGCWQGVIGDRDGNFASIWWPWEPYRKDSAPTATTTLDLGNPKVGGVHISAQVEQGLGYIEPLKHCPTSEAQGQIDYARNLREIGLLAWSDGWEVQILNEALDTMLKSFWKGPDNPEVLSEPYLYWSGCDKYLQQAQGEEYVLHFPAAVRVKSWTLARGYPYTLSARKLMRSRTRMLLKNAEGTRILTPDYLASIGEDLRYVVFTEYAYFDKDDKAISAPSGFLAAGTWHKTIEGTVTKTLSTHGVWSSPSLPLRKTRINNPDKSQKTASSQTDYRIARHYIQFWASDAYTKYDINATDGLAKMRASRAFRGDLDGGLTSEARLWVQSAETLQIETPHRLDAINAGDGANVVVFSGALRFAGDASKYPRNSVVIAYHSPGTDLPGVLLYQEGVVNPALGIDEAGRLLIPCETATDKFDLALLRNPLRAGGVTQMTGLEGFSHVSCCRDMGGGGFFVIAVRQRDSKLCLYRQHFTPSVPEPQWTFYAEIGDSDQTTGAIVATDSWRYTIYRIYGRTIYTHESTDGGVTWTQL